MRNTPDLFEVIRRVITDFVDGSPTFEWTPFGKWSGTFGLLSAEEVAAFEAQSAEASARLPLNADVEMTDRLRVLRPTHTAVTGDWEVVALRPNRAHLRVMIKRIQ